MARQSKAGDRCAQVVHVAIYDTWRAAECSSGCETREEMTPQLQQGGFVVLLRGAYEELKGRCNPVRVRSCSTLHMWTSAPPLTPHLLQALLRVVPLAAAAVPQVARVRHVLEVLLDVPHELAAVHRPHAGLQGTKEVGRRVGVRADRWPSRQQQRCGPLAACRAARYAEDGVTRRT